MPGQTDCSLAAEGHHHPAGLLHLKDILHILRRQRLKVETVCRVEIRGNSLRIIVDNHYLIAQPLQHLDTVNAGIVKLNSLPDTDGAGAKYHDGFPGISDKRQHLIFSSLLLAAVNAVEVRCLGGKLAGTGINHPVHRSSLRRQGMAGYGLKGAVCKAQFLASHIQLPGQLPFLNLLLIIDYISELPEKPLVNLCDPVDFLHCDPPS